MTAFAAMPVTAFAQEQGDANAPQELLAFTVAGGLGKLRVGFLLNVSFNEVLDLAYTVRNLTYDLFNWEIGYNVTAANVTLANADRFLDKAITLSETNATRAKVYAFVAAVHYTHAPAFANQVLCKAVKNNLGENNTITSDTVNAVLSVASELRELLEKALEYANTTGYNVTIAANIRDLGDNMVEEAEKYLDQGNVTEAFKYAVQGYKAYVKAYSALVKMVFAQAIREKVFEALTGKLVEYRENVAKRVINALPIQVRERVEARVERGELKSIKELINETKVFMARITAQIKFREKENLKHVVERVLENAELRIKEKYGKEVRIDVNEIVEKYYELGYRGVELASKVIENIISAMQERGIDINGISIPRPPTRPTIPHTKPGK